ncbi:hypothetical protein AHF37_03073 [Paragonimus kellicotti]|nr:hypothetical protein AHF37_03073 [Paragonimus kellicotti]
MGKKNKTKKGRGAEKTLKKTQQKLEKKLAKVEKESGEQSIEQLIEEFQQEQKKITEVTISPCSPPSPRSHFTLTASPESDELVLFGGEYYDGKKTTMFSDLFIYQCKDNRWDVIKSSNTPPPRSGHQAVYIKTSNTPASVWVFGGEYASPTQLRFYHYKDLWCLRLRTQLKEVARVQEVDIVWLPGKIHFCCSEGSVTLEGWLSDFLTNRTYSKTAYFNDMWIFSLDVLQWNPVKLTGDVPSPRSGCLLFPGSDMKSLYIFGGYFKEYVTRDMERGVACADFFRVNMEKDASVAKCICMRTSGIRPKPPRSAMAGVLQTANRVILFGGVHDIESEDGESVVGHFHNDMYVVDLEKAKWHLFNYTTGKQLVKSNPPVVSTHNNSGNPLFLRSPCLFDENIGFYLQLLLLMEPAVAQLEAATHDKSATITQNGDGNHVRTIPSPRSSPGVVVLGSTLYVYGGFYEVGDRKITLDDVIVVLDLSQPFLRLFCLIGSRSRKTTMFSDLFIYQCKDNRWDVIKSSNTPPPRSGHQAVYIKTSNTPASVWVFGGEYASPTQLRFYHYKDLWCLRLRTQLKEVARVQEVDIVWLPGKIHFCCSEGSVTLEGWLSDFLTNRTYSKTAYFNDMWIFSLDVLQWNPVKLTGDVPSPRSGCLLFPGSDMKSLYIFGGYFKEYVTRDMERGVACADFFRVNMEKDASVAKCICMRTSGIRPKPPRSAMAGVLQTANRVILFGGVHDIESEDGESVVGHFHNDMYVVDLEKAKWHLFNYTTGKQLVKSNPPVVSTHNNSDSTKMSDFTSNPPIDGASCRLLSDSVFTLTLQGSTEAATHDKSATITQNGDGNHVRTIPSPRSSPGVVVLGSTLYVYGGFYEVGDRKITLDDLYCLDLSQPISWRCLFNGSQAEQLPVSSLLTCFQVFLTLSIHLNYLNVILTVSCSTNTFLKEWYGSDSEEEEDEYEEAEDSNNELSDSGAMEVDVAASAANEDEDTTSSEDDSDEELIEDAPAPVPLETQNGYWDRTMMFWCNLVRQGLGEDEPTSPTTSQVPYDPAVLSLAKRLAKDFYNNNSHRKT